MGQTQLEKDLSTLIWGIADTLVKCSRIPFFYGLPKDQAEKLNDILRATDKLLRELKCLDHEVEQDLEVEPFNAPLVMEIQTASLVLCNLEKRVPDDPDDYPSNVIRSLRNFRDTVAKAKDFVKPKRGNATSRSLTTTLKSDIAKSLVFRHRSMTGKFPATSVDGWAANLLNDIFLKYKLGDVDAKRVETGAYWVKRAVQNLKKSTS